MRMDGIKQMPSMEGAISSKDASAAQRRLQKLHTELSGLEQKKELTKEEKQKKRELEGEIARLQQQIQQIKGKEGKEQEERKESAVSEKAFHKGAEEKD